VLVVGLGRSGVASALFLKSQGARVTVSDSKTEDQLRNEIPVLLDQGIALAPSAFEIAFLSLAHTRRDVDRLAAALRAALAAAA